MANVILKNGVGTPIEYKGIETIEVPQADVTIVPETEFSGFAYEEDFGLYIVDVNPSPITLEVGENYAVVWDGVAYDCSCQDLSTMAEGAIGIGNLANFGGTGNDEPFIMVIVDGVAMCASSDEGESHTITLNKKGGTQIFSEGVAVEMPTPIPLDFSTGNQTITAPKGYLVKSAILEKPDTLKPENIVKGVRVAGIEGEYECGGGGGGTTSPFVYGASRYATADLTTLDTYTQSVFIPKNSKIIGAYGYHMRSINATTYPNVTTLDILPISSLVIDDTISNLYNKVSYIWSTSNIDSYSTKAVFVFGLLFTIEEISVTPVGNGLFNATLTAIPDFANVFSNNNRLFIPVVTNLKSISFADGITTTVSSMCRNQIFLESADLSAITSIKSGTFHGCTGLTSITLNPNLTTLEHTAFFGCESLTGDLVIPSAIKTIPYRCFGKTKFNKVVFPSGFTKIDEFAFEDCTHSTEFDFSACTSVPTLYTSNSLGKVGNGQVLKIPSALFDSWSTASNWSEWASQMVAV